VGAASDSYIYIVGLVVEVQKKPAAVPCRETATAELASAVGGIIPDIPAYQGCLDYLLLRSSPCCLCPRIDDQQPERSRSVRGRERRVYGGREICLIEECTRRQLRHLGERPPSASCASILLHAASASQTAASAAAFC